MAYRVPKTVNKSFVNYAEESEVEIEKLSKSEIIAYSGSYSRQIIYVAIDKPEEILVIHYDLSNFSKAIYSDFNKRIKEL